ncbi:MAG TPA: hypothetical protein VET23_01315 [Chitinophagaceae bacterium]|nr:hypothetical protein [Chitinophagaceae bacterium]
MKSNKYIFLFLFFIVAGCGNNKEEKKPENDIDAARDFIRAALDGKFDEAKTYLLRDSSNLQYLDAVARNYEKMDADTKDNYHEASINIHRVNPINDSTTIVVYSNSFKNITDTLLILKTNQQWLVDLKYLFEHDRDTLYNRINQIDSTK